MKNVLENIQFGPEKLESIKEKINSFIAKHPEIWCCSILTICCLIFLFFGLGAYPLIDVDETRYAVMARDLLSANDWNNLMLNGVPFLEKPPLYFWFVALSIKLFGVFNSFAVRVPIALLSSGLVFFTYYIGKRVISRKFGMLSALILLSSIFFLILAHVAIIDMVLTVFMTISLYLFLLTHFCEEKNKKYYWFMFYVVAAFAFLAKGLLAIAIPGVIILVYNLVTKTAKDIFKPINMLPGLIVFAAIITPWHVLMYKEYGYEFVKMYFLLHHFARFINSEVIGRERPFWYFIPVFLMGFLPWAFIFIAFVCDGTKNIINKFKTLQGNFVNKLIGLCEYETKEQKIVLFSIISFVVIFLVFSSSSTKLPTYILPAFPFAALLTGHFWWTNAQKGEHYKAIENSTLILAFLFFFIGIGYLISYPFLPYNLQEKMESFRNYATYGMFFISMFTILRLKTKNSISIFSGYIVSMMFVIILATFSIFNFVYNTGENEIVQFSQYASKASETAKLVTFDFAVKPSVMIDYKNEVDFITDPDFDKLNEIVLSSKKIPVFVIAKNKNFDDNIDYMRKLGRNFNQVQRGERYSLFINK